MLRPERPHVDGLQSAQSTIVLNLHAREILQGIGHGGGRQVLQHLALEGLTGCKVMRALAHTHHLVERERVAMNRTYILRMTWHHTEAQ